MWINPRRDLCDAAKQGKLCVDDLCHNGGGETVCGFDPDLYAEMLDEDYPDVRDWDSDASEDSPNE